VSRVRRIIIAASSLAVAAAVSACGIIGFVGLMVPHAMRLIIGPDHRALLPFSFVGGGLYLLGMDLLSRIVIAPMELPVGILTAMFGGPFFIYLLRKNSR
jgi:iron complex transport system permease protein